MLTTIGGHRLTSGGMIGWQKKNYDADMDKNLIWQAAVGDDHDDIINGLLSKAIKRLMQNMVAKDRCVPAI